MVYRWHVIPSKLASINIYNHSKKEQTAKRCSGYQLDEELSSDVRKNHPQDNIRKTRHLYWNQTSRIKVNRRSREVRIKKDVRQGFILSPLLFNISSNKIFEFFLENYSE